MAVTLAPPTLRPEPAASSTLPASPVAEEPLLISTRPVWPSSVLPEVTWISPDVASAFEAADAMRTAPLDLRPAPLVSATWPPVVRPNVVPAVNDTSPPAPERDVPALTRTSPAFPSTASPDAMATLPDNPNFAVPEDSPTDPDLRPAAPEPITTSPDTVSTPVPAPLCNKSLPPVPVSPVAAPAPITTLPPTPGAFTFPAVNKTLPAADLPAPTAMFTSPL